MSRQASDFNSCKRVCVCVLVGMILMLHRSKYDDCSKIFPNC